MRLIEVVMGFVGTIILCLSFKEHRENIETSQMRTPQYTGHLLLRTYLQMSNGIHFNLCRTPHMTLEISSTLIHKGGKKYLNSHSSLCHSSSQEMR